MKIACAFDHAGFPLKPVVLETLAAEIIAAFAVATFSGEERHVRRLGKINAIEREFTGG